MRYELGFVDEVGDPAEQKMDRQIDDGKAGEKYRSFGLAQSFPHHHRNEMSRHGGERDRAAGHRADEIPKNRRAERFARGDIGRRCFTGRSIARSTGTSVRFERQAVGAHADALGRTLYPDAQRHAGYEKQHAGEKRRPAPAEGMDCDPEKRRDQCAADRHCRADDGHRASAQTDEPTVGDNRRRVHETGGERERDDAEVDDRKVA